MKDEKEWMRQAEYEYNFARVAFRARRYGHTIFLCHLAIEKALKALYCLKFKEDPPRIHNLMTLVKETKITMPAELMEIINKLSALSVQTRYPEDIRRVSKIYTRAKTEHDMKQCREVLKWIKEQL